MIHTTVSELSFLETEQVRQRVLGDAALDFTSICILGARIMP